MDVSPGQGERIPATPLGTPYSVRDNDLWNAEKTPKKTPQQKQGQMEQLRQQVEALQGQLDDRIKKEQSYKTVTEQRIRSLEGKVEQMRDEGAALRLQVSTLQEDLKVTEAKAVQLQQTISEWEAKRVSAGGALGGALGAGQDDGKQQQQQSTVMVQVKPGLSPDQIAAQLIDAAGMQSSSIVIANAVASKKASSSYAAAAAIAADAPGNNSSSSNGSQVDQQGGRVTRSTSRAASSGASATSGGNGKASNGKAGSSGSGTGSGSTSGAKDVPDATNGGKVWVRVRLASPSHALQLLRKRADLKKVGFRVEEALSKEELALKASYLDKGIPAKVWEAEKAPVSWRRGQLFKLIKGEQGRGRWELVPLTYAPTEK